MKKLKSINAGKPTSSDQFNALVDVVNLLLRKEQTRVISMNAAYGNSIIKFSLSGLEEIFERYPGMFEDVE